MPTMNNVLVTGAFDNIETVSGKQPKLIRIKQNGWLVAAFVNGRTLHVYISRNGITFDEEFYVREGYPENTERPLDIVSFDIGFINKRILLLVAFYDKTKSYGEELHLFDFSAVDGFWHQRPNSNTLVISGYKSLDRCSLVVNGDGTELHVAFSAVSTTYRPTSNIFYTKATRVAGKWQWAFPTAITTLSSSDHKFLSPTVLLNEAGNPVIVYEQGSNFSTGTNGSYWIFVTVFQGGVWTPRNRIFSQGFARSPDKSKPEAVFVPRAINGLEQGRMVVAWTADDLDVPTTNVAAVYSDDGGLTWSWYTQLSSGSAVYSENVTLGADKSGQIFAALESWKYDNRDIRTTTMTGTTWGPLQNRFATPNQIEAGAAILTDFSIITARPLVMYKKGTHLYIDGEYENLLSIAPEFQDLGLLADPPAPSYTITSDTSIVEIRLLLDEDEIGIITNPTSLTRTAVVTPEVWRAIPYWKRHRLDVVARESSGETATASFWFAKKLRGNEPLSEIIRASNDAKDYIMLKRDRIAVQVGLPAGSTFDQISDHLDNEAVVAPKSASGVVSGIYGGTITVRSLNFRPSTITILNVDNEGHVLSFAYFTERFTINRFDDEDGDIAFGVGIKFIHENSTPMEATVYKATVYNDGFSLFAGTSTNSIDSAHWFAEK